MQWELHFTCRRCDEFGVIQTNERGLLHPDSKRKWRIETDRLFDDNKDMFTADFVLVGALKRALSLSDGFRKHIRDRNFICTGTLLRAHLIQQCA